MKSKCEVTTHGFKPLPSSKKACKYNSFCQNEVAKERFGDEGHDIYVNSIVYM
jgi:hypothetical protein